MPIQASDPNNGTLAYSASGLPTGLSINSTTGLISGSIASTAGSDTPYAVTVTVSDNTNHTVSATFNWTVANQLVQVTNPGTQSNAEGDNVSLQINASEPSGNGLSYTASGLPTGVQIDYASGLISGTIDSAAAESNGGVYQVTVLADDGQGNNGSTTFTWNISHTNQAPTLDNPGDQVNQVGDVVALALNGYDEDGDTVSYSATGLPPGVSLDPSLGIISGTLSASAATSTPYNVTVTVSDGSLTGSQTFNWFVTQSPVTLTSPGDQTNTEGDSVSVQLSASGDSTLTYQASGLPSGISLNTTTGLISGTVATGDAANGPYIVTVTAADTQGNSSAEQFAWNVNAVNQNPVVTNPGAQINTQGDVLSLPMQATDPAGNGLTYSATGLPPGLSIDSTSGLISGVLSNTSATGSPYTVTLTATDGNAAGSTTFAWSVTNQAVTVTNPGTQTSSGGAAVSLQINASDPAQQPLTYAAAGLPSGATIDANTGLITGILATTDGGAYQVTVMASDTVGNSGSTVFTWNVSYVNQAPTLDNPGDQLNQAGDVVSLPLSASDVDGDTLSYSATGLPPGVSIDPSSGIISGTLSASSGSATPYSVTVTVADGSLTASQTFNWFVTQSPVTLTSPGDQTNTEGDNVSLQLSATGDSTLTYQASGLPSGLSINNSTGLISGAVASGDAANGPYTVTVSATDSQGNGSTQQFTWNVNESANALTLTNPGNQSNAEGDNVSLQVQANDPDSDTLEYAVSGLPIGLMIDPNTGLIQGTVDYSAAEIAGGQYNVTVTVNDGNGDTASQSFVWTIAPTEQGPWLQYPEFQDSQTGTEASLQLVGGSPDGLTLTYSATGLPAGLTVNATTGLIGGTITGAAGSYSVTASVSDGTLTASQTFTWQVTSGAAPQIQLSFDGQPAGDDGLAEIGSSTPVPLTVTLQGASPGLHTIQISIPSGMSEINQPTFQLANGGSETVELTPEQVSEAFDDVHLVVFLGGNEAKDADETNVKVTIAGAQNGGHVRNADTPTGMTQDRIPPVKDPTAAKPSPWTTVAITITPTLKDAKVVVFQVANNGGVNGTVNFLNSFDYPKSSVYDQESGSLFLVGLAQTAPTPDGKGGNAGKLSIVAYPGTQKDKKIASVDTKQQLAKSAGFSVAAIPIKVTAQLLITWHPRAYIYANTGNEQTWKVYWGPVYEFTYVSDSGNPKDLDQIRTGEVLSIISQKGSYAKYTVPPNLGYGTPLTGTPGPTDTNTQGRTVAAKSEAEAIKNAVKEIQTAGPGTLIVNQTEIFADARTGTGTPLSPDQKGAQPIAASGFQLKEVIEKKDGQYFYTVTRTAQKVGAIEAGTVNGKNPVAVEIKPSEKEMRD